MIQCIRTPGLVLILGAGIVPWLLEVSTEADDCNMVGFERIVKGSDVGVGVD